MEAMSELVALAAIFLVCRKRQLWEPNSEQENASCLFGTACLQSKQQTNCGDVIEQSLDLCQFELWIFADVVNMQQASGRAIEQEVYFW
jgi:hypothetical protein